MKNPRACLLIALLAAPAWSQESAGQPTASAPVEHSFDLRDETVKKIVRDTAATQFAVVRISEDTPRPEQSKAVETAFLPATPAAKQEATVVRLPEAEPREDFLSALIDTLLEDDSVSFAELHDEWLSCQSRDNMKTTSERAADCPKAGGDQRAVHGNPTDFKTVPSP